MDKHARDPLQRPTKNKGLASIPLASDVLVASASRRFVAYLLDMAFILPLTWYGSFPLATLLFATKNSPPLQLFTLAFFLTWGLYVTLSNAAPTRATIGQGLMRIYVATVFGNTLSPFTALGRFVVFSAPMLCVMIGGMGEIAHFIPITLAPESSAAASYPISNELLYTLLIIPLALQVLMIWPMLSGKYSRVLWDRLFHSCVLRATPRTL
jgi:uncharacterized RDD family membrane protein YckC